MIIAAHWAPPSASATAETLYFPLVTNPARQPTPWQPIPGAGYRLLSIVGGASPLAAEQHPDVNLALRGFTVALGESPRLINNCGVAPDDYGAPRLRGLFADHRAPAFAGVYWVFQWDWARNRPSSAVESAWGPSYATVSVSPGEILRVPPSGYCIDQSQDLEVLVLYATTERVTLKYTREDSVISGYTLHLEGVHVDPALEALYEAADLAGRSQLPALRADQPFARARADTLGIAIRDCGAWMDPRSCADWWRE